MQLMREDEEARAAGMDDRFLTLAPPRRNTARHGRIPSYYEFAPRTFQRDRET